MNTLRFLFLLSLALLTSAALAQEKKDAGLGGLAADAELVETRTEVPRLKAAAAYTMKDNIVEIELSQYAGYAGLVAANNGLAPTEDSIFFKKHGFKVKLTLSESESWSALNSGRIAASATTADVLAVYGKQFQVVVPAQIGFSRGADGIVVRSSIKKINDLKGKIIAAPQFTEADFFLRYLAQEAGLAINMLPDLKTAPDPAKVNMVFCADAEGAANLFNRDLKAGRTRLAGFVGWAPFTSDAVEGSDGKATMLVSNRNLLVIADILIVNKGFAAANPKIMAGLVNGLLEGNQLVRDNPDSSLELLAKALKFDDKAKTRAELAKVHLANLPENLAFFSGAIDAAGSFGGIYQSAVYAYGSDLIRNPVDAEKFFDVSYLKAIEQSGAFKNQKIAIAPIRSSANQTVEGDPLLSKDIRFLFQPNSAILDLANADNTKNLEAIKKLLQVSPGSTVLLRGHVDNSMIDEFRRKGGEALVRQQAMRAMELSKNRANEVKRILIEKNSVDAARIDSVGRGWDEPVGKPEENRRVEVQWFTLE
ncbi:MAG: phosphate ABC transporter substrate-binding/OmpA family protein [Tepidisphaeraceae bacterium]|jgi:NitT/TauT family transport system substrate-binding protein